MARTPAAEVRERRSVLRAAMRRDGVGAVLLSLPASVHYYSGFTGEDSLLLLSSSKAFLITDFRYVEEADASTWDTDVVTWRQSPATEAGALARKLGVKRLGFEERVLPVADAEAVRKAVKRTRLHPWQATIRAPRQTKSAWEVRAIGRALRVAEAAFTETRGLLQPGMSELDVANELDYRMRRLGAGAAAFPTIAACRANASLPHAHPGKRKLRTGDLLLIDWGARVGAYNSDLTRTLFLGSIPRRWRRRYESVLAAQRAAIESFAEGSSGADVDRVARQRLAGDRLAERFGHGLGHGVGLEVHEGPNLSRRNGEPLPVGAVLTVEPGVYFPRQGGIRIEDMVLVTTTGAQVLSTLPTDLDAAVI